MSEMMGVLSSILLSGYLANTSEIGVNSMKNRGKKKKRALKWNV